MNSNIVHRDLKDPYLESKQHKFDDFKINKMFNFEKNYEKDKQVNYVNFIKNKLHYFDVAFNFADPNASEIFDTGSIFVVDLENFHTVVKPIGAPIHRHFFTNNINKNIRELILHLKQNCKYKIYFEKLDNRLLD